MTEHDDAIFHRYAEYLWQRAGGMVARWIAWGAVLGAALGSVMLTSWANWPLSHRHVYLLVALGAVAGGFLGRSLGGKRALGLRLQAQLAQHQLRFERSTLERTAAIAAARPGQVEPARPEAREVEVPVVAAPPYVPAGAPLVSALDAAVSPAPPESYGWAGIEPPGK